MSGTDASPHKAHWIVKWKSRAALIAAVVVIVGSAVVVRTVWGPGPAGAEVRQANGAAAKGAAPGKPVAPTEQKMQVMAAVNNQQITRDDLARECLLHHGKDVLESLVNKHLIAEHCKARGITVTTAEVDEEIDRMAARFGMSSDQWIGLLKEERNITPAQYAKDIIWPTIALRKLADSRLVVTPEDMKIAYETQFGPKVQARVIVANDARRAAELRAEALKNPEEFGNIAKEKSADAGSASAKGMIQPVQMHMGDPAIERVAFSLREGEISEVFPVQNQFVVMKCEALIPARPVPMEQVQKVLSEAIRDKKMRLAAKDVFEELQRDTAIDNIFNDPAKRAKNPGIAATINGHPISMQELAEECIERHGKDSLKGLINHRLVEQACQRRQIQITQAELDAEVMRAAMLGAKPLPDGKPDLAAWRKFVIEQQEMSWEMYLHEVVWPEVALKKLVGNSVQVTEDDLIKGFEANYGPRVRVRAIVLNHQRRAQEAWEAARKYPPIEKLAQRKAQPPGTPWADPAPDEQALVEEGAKLFGKLAAQTSIEVGSSALEGEVPPIQRFGTQPLLEKEAFSLRAGELSGIVQVGDKFVILYCEGRTKPQSIKFEEVRNLITEDVREKKLRMAMSVEFDKIQAGATIDNYLAGTTQSPHQEERNLFQRVSAEEDIEPKVPRSSHSGPAQSQLPIGRAPQQPRPAPVRK